MNATDNPKDNTTIAYRFVHERGSPTQIIELLTLIIIMIVALSANLVAFTTIMTDKKLRRNTHNLLVLNLILMDLGISIFSMPFSLISIFDSGYLLETYPFLCKMNGFFASLCTFGNFSTVLFIAADRYLAVVWAARYPSTRKRVSIMIVIAWVLSLLVGAAPLTERLSFYHYSSSTHHCSPAWMSCFFYIFNFTFIYGMAVPTMLISHAYIIYTLRAKEKKLRSYGINKPAPSSRSEDRINANTDSAATGTDISMEGIPEKRGGTPKKITQITTITSGKMLQASSLHSLSVDFGDTSDTVGTSDLDLSNSGTPRAQKKADAAKSKGAKAKRDKQTNLAMKWQSLSVDKQVAVAGALVVLTTVICWAPYTVVHACFVDITPSHMVGTTTMWLGYSNAMLDPLIYAFFNRQIRTKIVGHFQACFSFLN